ncbi:MAG: LysM peptidoglycan-binding domain-containing protein [Acidobacteria bacterium]|nr:LysM peptidoglycan-binding domain-containing protein [Acidobacteriota bacterium]
MPRLFRICAASVGLSALGLSGWLWTGRTLAAPAVQASAAAVSQPGMSTMKPTTATLTYTVGRGDTIPAIARHYLSRTSFLTSTELASAIRQANGKSGNFVKSGDTLSIPGMLDSAIVEKPVVVPRDFEARAIYLTGVMAGSEHGLGIIRRWRELGGNAVVFDVKDSDGILNIPFDHPLAIDKRRPVIPDLPKFAHFLHSEGMHAIARIAIFRDEHLVVTHPELAVHSRRTGQPWRENGKLVWTDPSNPKVQEYVIALARRAAQAGVDEIQFDYVRFPAEGEQKDAAFLFQKQHPDWERSDVITDFLRQAYTALHSEGVLLSLDVFGVMAWQRSVDLAHTGQDIPGMAKYCDVLSPMIYPSHFFGMDGYAHPGDAPEHFIGESMARFLLITKDSGVVLRPWLQAFRWRTKTYSSRYVEIQVKVAKEKGGDGFLFWNANNNYAKPYEAMPNMRADKLFRGDELPGFAKVASAGAPRVQIKMVSSPAR